MKPGLLAATLGVAIAVAVPQVSHADNRLTDADCTALFRQLNTDNSGQMTAAQAAANPIAKKAFANMDIQKKGYMTESDFRSSCVGSDEPPAPKP
jgi:Ca2+-binding EF-hand superfamily protein